MTTARACARSLALFPPDILVATVRHGIRHGDMSSAAYAVGQLLTVRVHGCPLLLSAFAGSLLEDTDLSDASLVSLLLQTQADLTRHCTAGDRENAVPAAAQMLAALGATAHKSRFVANVHIWVLGGGTCATPRIAMTRLLEWFWPVREAPDDATPAPPFEPVPRRPLILQSPYDSIQLAKYNTAPAVPDVFVQRLTRPWMWAILTEFLRGLFLSTVCATEDTYSAYENLSVNELTSIRIGHALATLGHLSRVFTALDYVAKHDGECYYQASRVLTWKVHMSDSAVRERAVMLRTERTRLLTAMRGLVRLQLVDPLLAITYIVMAYRTPVAFAANLQDIAQATVVGTDDLKSYNNNARKTITASLRSSDRGRFSEIPAQVFMDPYTSVGRGGNSTVDAAYRAAACAGARVCATWAPELVAQSESTPETRQLATSFSRGDRMKWWLVETMWVPERAQNTDGTTPLALHDANANAMCCEKIIYLCGQWGDAVMLPPRIGVLVWEMRQAMLEYAEKHKYSLDQALNAVLRCAARSDGGSMTLDEVVETTLQSVQRYDDPMDSQMHMDLIGESYTTAPLMPVESAMYPCLGEAARCATVPTRRQCRRQREAAAVSATDERSVRSRTGTPLSHLLRPPSIDITTPRLVTPCPPTTPSLATPSGRTPVFAPPPLATPPSYTTIAAAAAAADAGERPLLSGRGISAAEIPSRFAAGHTIHSMEYIKGPFMSNEATHMKRLQITCGLAAGLRASGDAVVACHVPTLYRQPLYAGMCGATEDTLAWFIATPHVNDLVLFDQLPRGATLRTLMDVGRDGVDVIAHVLLHLLVRHALMGFGNGSLHTVGIARANLDRLLLSHPSQETVDAQPLCAPTGATVAPMDCDARGVGYGRATVMRTEVPSRLPPLYAFHLGPHNRHELRVLPSTIDTSDFDIITDWACLGAAPSVEDMRVLRQVCWLRRRWMCKSLQHMCNNGEFIRERCAQWQIPLDTETLRTRLTCVAQRVVRPYGLRGDGDHVQDDTKKTSYLSYWKWMQHAPDGTALAEDALPRDDGVWFVVGVHGENDKIIAMSAAAWKAKLNRSSAIISVRGNVLHTRTGRVVRLVGMPAMAMTVQ